MRHLTAWGMVRCVKIQGLVGSVDSLIYNRPLYPTCDVHVPHTRTVTEMMAVLDIIAVPDRTAEGDFWRQQQFVEVPPVWRPESFLDLAPGAEDSIRGKRIAVPKMYIGGHDPTAKPTVVSQDVIDLWRRARKDLETLGASVIETDFPLVTNYEDDSESGHTNNVEGFKPDWNGKERGELVAYLWDDFLRTGGDPKFSEGLGSVDGSQMFPRPEGYIPDRTYITGRTLLFSSITDAPVAQSALTLIDLFEPEISLTGPKCGGCLSPN